MQNDWAKLLLMIEFIDNNALFSVIFSTSVIILALSDSVF